MIGLLIISHSDLGQGFKIALEHICGEQRQLETISIYPEDTVGSRLDDVLQAIQRLDQGQGVLLLTDIFGATPSNIAFSAQESDVEVEVIAGLNLPMLVKLVCQRKPRDSQSDISLEHLAFQAKRTGGDNIYLGKDIVCSYTPKTKIPS